MSADSMLTTIDNPFDPFTQYEEWWSYDHAAGYCTCEYLGRIANVSPRMTDEMIEDEIDKAMNEIVRINSNLYKIVTANDKQSTADKKD